ncbi:hypothetical protein QWY87_16930 [Lutimonas halocynthiae]|uniref:hypothetical protein n=1 Tax=Lutimonas halocynthiae TaxID=1446477 RepID=UPI0025B3C57B|nr:hypothetical protein [Lutimonas halocynthiae]MDN3644401.1 hypothetical protein [Lutimonas halocynthiae]
MTLQEGINILESLKNQTTKKSEIKVYEKFLHILTALKSRTFSKDEIQSIETELDRLYSTSNPENRKKHFKKALTKFEKYLKDTFSLTSKGYYAELGITLGMTFGVVLGVLIGQRFERSLGISLGISLGMLIGIIVGRHMDSQAKASGNML